MLLLLLLFSYTLFAQEADQNPNSLTYEQYVKERQKQQQLLLNSNTPRAALDYDDEIDGLLDQLQGMANKAKKVLSYSVPKNNSLLYCSEFIQRRPLSPFCAIYQHELFTVYRYHLSDALTFSLHLGTDLNGNSMTQESEAKIYRETRHPELQKSYAQIAEDAIEAIKKELPTMSTQEKRKLLEKALYNIKNYQENYQKLLEAQRKLKQGVARAQHAIKKLEKFLHNLENKPANRPNPFLILLFTKPELLKEEDPFFI